MQFWTNRKERKGILPLLAALAPYVLGALSAGGSAYASNRNRQSAKDQMAFQERMSSTAAQRSVEDYRAAGLNPALAYERTASSPGGASTTFEDPVTKGISSARDAKAFIETIKQMKLTQHKTQREIAAIDAGNEASMGAANLSNAQARATTLQTGWAAAAQPANLALANAQALLTGHQAQAAAYQLPGLRNTAAWENRIGSLTGIMGSARSLTEIIKALSGIRRF